ncbi:MAG: non-homologous end-joining DNA ligase [Bdellovibrionota bacterium]
MQHAGQKYVRVDGQLLRLTNLGKILYPQSHFTKQDVLYYYRKIAPALLPHLAHRALTLKRYPDGVNGEYFYEKRCPSYRPSWVRTRRFNEIDFCEIDGLASLIWAANLGSLELHPSLSGSEEEVPTTMVFDLDPGPPAGLLDCAFTAIEVREMLRRLGLESFPKTSGGKGLQLYVPINMPADYEGTKGLSRLVAERLEREFPDRIVSRMAKDLRAGKVFIDWSQNDRNKTTVAVYSLRATPEPRVSTPLNWTEVEAAVHHKNSALLRYTPAQAIERVMEHGDLFAPVLTLRQNISGISRIAA